MLFIVSLACLCGMLCLTLFGGTDSGDKGYCGLTLGFAASNALLFFMASCWPEESRILGCLLARWGENDRRTSSALLMSLVWAVIALLTLAYCAGLVPSRCR